MDTEQLETILEPAAAGDGRPPSDEPPVALAVPPEEPEPAAPEPDPDPLEARLEAFGEKLIARFEERQSLARVEASEAAAKARHADFEEKAAAFAREAERDPGLIREMAAADDPGEFAYARGRQAIELAGIDSLDALKAKLRAEWEAELKTSLPRPAAPATTATQRSIGARSGPEWSGPREIGDLLPPLG